MEPGEVEPGEVEPGEVEPGDVEPGDVEPGEAEPGLPQSVPNSLHLKSHSTKHIVTRTLNPTAPIIIAELILVIDL